MEPADPAVGVRLIPNNAGAADVAHESALQGQKVTASNFIPGATVTRGEDWRWRDQDGGSPGILVQLQGQKAVVRWASGRESTYRVGEHNAYDLIYGTKPAPPAAVSPEQQAALNGQPVTPENFMRGATVTRGQDWARGDADGRQPMVLLRLDADGDCCFVRFADGRETNPRCGFRNAYDLVYGTVFALPPIVSASRQAEIAGQRVTRELFVPGAVVTRGPDWRDEGADGGRPGVLRRLDADGDQCFVVFGISPGEPAQDDGEEHRLRIGYTDAYDLVYGNVPNVAPLDLDAGEGYTIAHASEQVTRANFTRGAVVTRGPGWQSGDQDGGSPGVLLRLSRDDVAIPGGDAGVWVQWADGYEKLHQSTELIFRSASRSSDAPSHGQLVTRANFAVGATVTRGPDWQWGAQDGSGLRGHLVEIRGDGSATVRWENGTSNSYRIGTEGSHDLVYGDIPWAALQTPPPPAPTPRAAAVAAQPPSRDGQRVTVDLITAGAVVSRGPDWKWGDQDGGRPGRLTGGLMMQGTRAVVEWEDGSVCACRVSDGIADLVFGPRPFHVIPATPPPAGGPPPAAVAATQVATPPDAPVVAKVLGAAAAVATHTGGASAPPFLDHELYPRMQETARVIPPPDVKRVALTLCFLRDWPVLDLQHRTTDRFRTDAATAMAAAAAAASAGAAAVPSSVTFLTPEGVRMLTRAFATSLRVAAKWFAVDTASVQLQMRCVTLELPGLGSQRFEVEAIAGTRVADVAAALMRELECDTPTIVTRADRSVLPPTTAWWDAPTELIAIPRSR
jgi:hypothetical protein